MLINRKKNSKPGQHDRIIYISLFIIFIGGILTTFVYSVKFIGQAMNSTFSATELGVVEEKYGQLHLDKYNLVAKKLGLTTSNAPLNTENNIIEEEIEMEVIEDDTLIEDDLIDEVAEEPTVIIPEVSPSIIVVNSTQTSGLAADLRNLLQAEDFNVISIGSSRDNLTRTVIKAKSNYDSTSQYLTDIKKIVSLQYDYETTILEDEADHDIEIIIGTR